MALEYIGTSQNGFSLLRNSNGVLLESCAGGMRIYNKNVRQPRWELWQSESKFHKENFTVEVREEAEIRPVDEWFAQLNFHCFVHSGYDCLQNDEKSPEGKMATLFRTDASLDDFWERWREQDSWLNVWNKKCKIYGSLKEVEPTKKKYALRMTYALFLIWMSTSLSSSITPEQLLPISFANGCMECHLVPKTPKKRKSNHLIINCGKYWNKTKTIQEFLNKNVVKSQSLEGPRKNKKNMRIC